MNIQIIIIFFIILLYFIDKYHREYRIKHSKKDIKYRNSHSVYDNTDYSKYKPYKEVYTYKIASAILFLLLIFITFSNQNTFMFINFIFFKNKLTKASELILISLIIIVTLFLLYNNRYKKIKRNFKLNLETILIFLIFFILLLFFSNLVYH